MDGRRRDVGDRDLIDSTVTITIDTITGGLYRLHTDLIVESRADELAQ